MERKRFAWKELYQKLAEEPPPAVSPLPPLSDSAVTAHNGPNGPELVLAFQQINGTWADKLEKEWKRNSPLVLQNPAPSRPLEEWMRARDIPLPFLTNGLKEWVWDPIERQLFAQLIGLWRLRDCVQNHIKDTNEEWLHVYKQLYNERIGPRAYLYKLPNFDADLAEFFGLKASKPAEYTKSSTPDKFQNYLRDHAAELQKALAEDKPWFHWRNVTSTDPVAVALYEEHVVKSDKQLMPKEDKVKVQQMCQRALFLQLADALAHTRDLLEWQLMEQLPPAMEPPPTLSDVMQRLYETTRVHMTALARGMDDCFLQHMSGPEPIIQWFIRLLQQVQETYAQEIAQRVEADDLPGVRRDLLERDPNVRVRRRLGLESAFYKRFLSDLAWELHARLERYLDDDRALTRAQMETAVQGIQVLRPLLAKTPDPHQVLSKGMMRQLCISYPVMEQTFDGLIKSVFKPSKTPLPRAAPGPVHEPDTELGADRVRSLYLEGVINKSRYTAEQLKYRGTEDTNRYDPEARRLRHSMLRLTLWLVRHQSTGPRQSQGLLELVDWYWMQHLLHLNGRNNQPADPNEPNQFASFEDDPEERRLGDLIISHFDANHAGPRDEGEGVMPMVVDVI
jgi:hypothetical protein